MNQQNHLHLWRNLFEANNSQQYVGAWLELQCQMLEKAMSGVVILGPVDKGPFAPVAFWPLGQKNQQLAQLAEKCMQERKSYIVDSEENAASTLNGKRLAYPLLLNNQLHGVVVLEINKTSEDEAQEIMRQLQWGCAWLDSLFLRQGKHSSDTVAQDVAAMLSISNSVLEQKTLYGASLKLVNELAGQLNFARVSVSFVQSGHARIQAISHNADFDKKMNLVRNIEVAMDEALDQQRTVCVPPLEENEVSITHAHSKLLEAQNMKIVCTIPIGAENDHFGAITFEADKENVLDVKRLEECKRVVGFVSPVLLLKHEHEQSIPLRIKNKISKQIEMLFGTGFIARKIGLVCLILVVTGLALLKGDFRITARAFLEGSVQSALVAPFDSYVANAPVRAGDRVQQGTLLVSLDDRDLKLEHLRLNAQSQQIDSQLREAMSTGQRAQTNILEAQSEQIDAQMELIDEQIARTQLTAPFDGVVVSGDLSQSLGAPLRKGEVLFEIAPLEAYRIILEVDDHDIAQIKNGFMGSVVLSAFPDESLAFEVTKITPVASAREGRNYFRVEAELSEINVELRPGMEGIGKVFVSRRNLFWILTRDLADWFRIWTWTWLP